MRKPHGDVKCYDCETGDEPAVIYFANVRKFLCWDHYCFAVRKLKSEEDKSPTISHKGSTD